MKYLKFYEAFKSKGVSNTLKFLKDKVGKNSSGKFLEYLKQFMTVVDFPIDKISDNDIKYMSAKKALELKSEDNVTNPKGIWVIKFWFSLEKGYLGFTGTGNQVKEISGEGGSHNGLRNTESFSESDLNYIKQNITRTGEIWPVMDYKKLETGQTVIGQFNDHSVDSIGFAKIFVDRGDRNRTYVIQSICSGSEPESTSSWRGYTEFGSNSWWIYDNDEMDSDHRKLHFYRPSSEELHYIEPPVEKEEVENEKTEEDPLTWNLPLSNRFSFSGWGRSSFSIDSIEKIKEADFSLVLYFDDMINPEKDAPYYEKPSEIKQQRYTQKEDVLAFMTDEKIKKQNIERYISKLSSQLEISSEDLSNLGRIVNKCLSNSSYINISMNRRDIFSTLNSLCRYLYSIITDESKEYYIEQIKNLYKNINQNYYKDQTQSLITKSLIKGSPFEKPFKKVFDLGNYITDKVRKENAKSLDDVLIIQNKLNSIRQFMHNEFNRLSYAMRNMIGEFYSEESFRYYIKEYSEQGTSIYREEDLNNDLKMLDRIEKYIKSIL
jgi:hypothetical protein